MRRKARAIVLSRPAAAPTGLKTLLIAGVLAATAVVATRADASVATPDVATTRDAGRYMRALQRTSPTDNSLRRVEFSDKDYSAFSGVGVVACTSGDSTRSSTAFLVGAFDLAVTVAHTFATAPGEPDPECMYNSMDAYGQVRERIPVAYVKSQWDAEGAAGEPTKDLAVMRLSQPSRYAQRTMPLGRYSGSPTPAVLVGYKSDGYVDTVKHKAHGSVYAGRAQPVKGGFSHDIDSRGLAAGAPLIDERSGVIIGIHAPIGERNAMITMNEWLERTLRDEMKPVEQAGAKAIEP